MADGRKYTKVARADAEARTRTALLDAAAELFFSKPWGQLTLEAVAGRAGVTKQTLLRHFGSKRGLAEQVFLRDFETVRDQRMAAPDNDIEGAIDNLLDHYEDHGERALKIQAMEAVPVVPGFLERARQFHYDWVAHAFAPWLAAAKGRRRERLHRALIALCDVQTWSILARDLGLPRSEVRATLLLGVRRVLEEPA